MSNDPALDNLKKQIQKARKAAHPSEFQEVSTQSLTGKFFNVGVELVSGVLVGAGLGILVDWGFGTSPWGLICLFILGSAAGILNVYRTLTSNKTKDPKKDE